MNGVVVIIRAGSIGQAIARRVSVGKKILLADPKLENAQAAAKVPADAGLQVSTALADISKQSDVRPRPERHGAWRGHRPHPCSRRIANTGLAEDHPDRRPLRHGAGTRVVESVMARGSAGVLTASQSCHRLPALPPEQDKALAMTPAEDVLALPLLQPDQIKTPCTPSRSPSAATPLGSWRRPLAGASAQHGSTRSAQGTPAQGLRAMSSRDHVVQATSG